MEEWKIIDGHEDVYSISNKGRVRNNKTNFILSSHITKQGYIRIGLKIPNTKKYKNHVIHRLVANAFIDNPLNKSEVNHINGIKTDNHIDNLEWVTRKENQLHASRVLKLGRGENNGGSKLTEFEVLIICEMFKKLSFIKIAKIINVSESLIRMIAHGLIWTNTTERLPHIPFYTLNKHRFTDEEVLYICELYKTGFYTIQAIANTMEQPLHKIDNIIYGRAYANITKDLKYLPYCRKTP